ncbi:hypothetical protein EYC87_15580 [Halieaceae bacterium IMCC8485]|uniref:Uncharacterized protein n=1 Tax=Candidatus Seongchinamella marina TaxID=2518990 RepID=A0ABT3SYC4_9GAMM|nr:hypothetical protein [Candidatus Seongchinamella marina]MCX2975011.1 hypothetical protein [Candidatus Seongchinamella marina]
MSDVIPLSEKVSLAIGRDRLTPQQKGNLELLLTQTLMQQESETITVIQMRGLVEMAQAATPDMGAMS